MNRSVEVRVSPDGTVLHSLRDAQVMAEGRSRARRSSNAVRQRPLFKADDFDEDSAADDSGAPPRVVAPPPDVAEEPPRIRQVQLRLFKSLREFTLDLG